jgi:hypothetical protein
MGRSQQPPVSTCLSKIAVCAVAAPEAIRMTAVRNNLPVDAIPRVRVLDPYFYL